MFRCFLREQASGNVRQCLEKLLILHEPLGGSLEHSPVLSHPSFMWLLPGTELRQAEWLSVSRVACVNFQQECVVAQQFVERGIEPCHCQSVDLYDDLVGQFLDDVAGGREIGLLARRSAKFEAAPYEPLFPF